MRNFLLSLAIGLFGLGSLMAQSQGDLLISEWNANPNDVSDNNGEYIELYNRTSSSINIDNWIIKDDGSNSHTINSTNGNTIVPAYGFLVLGLGDGSYNKRDYVYVFTLSNTSDEIVLVSPDDIEICRVNYSDGDPFGSGIACELVNVENHTNGVTLFSDYVAATDLLMATDKGSPGFAGNSIGTGGADNSPPVLSWTPINMATNIPTTSNIIISFNEAVRNTDDSEITDTNVASLILFKETDNTGADVSYTASINSSKKEITVNPNNDLTNNQDYFVSIKPIEDLNDNETNKDSISFTTMVTKAEPTNHVSDFNAKAISYNSIGLSWLDADVGSQRPDAYLIKASTGIITSPIDGIDPSEDNDFSDGSAIVKVSYNDLDTISFIGLLPGVNYNFQIWSYTNEGSTIDYKLDISGPDDNASTTSSDLFFSEYIEGSSNNKALEIYNGTGSDVDLGSYTVNLYGNGSLTSTGSKTLEGTLINGDVFVITNSKANELISLESDTVLSIANFNGNDALGLLHHSVLIDVIGTIGVDPGEAWNVAGTDEATLNHTLIRKIGRNYGNTNWEISAGTSEDNSEWIVLPQDNSNNLGTYRDVERDTSLSDLRIDGISIAGFNSEKCIYNLELPYGTTHIPTVYGIANSSLASIDTIQATSLTGSEVERTATITVTGDDSGTKDYYVIFSIAPNNENDITSFIFEGLEPELIGIIDTTLHTVRATVPYGTNVTALVPTITISANARVNPQTGVVQDFSNPVDYTVIAEDETDQIWTVTIIIEDNTENDIISFIFEDLEPELIGIIDATLHTVRATVPYGTNVTRLAPTVVVSADATVSPLSGATTDFSNPVNYTVTAQDLTDQNWLVTVDITPASTDASLRKLTVALGTLVPDFASGTFFYTVELPFGTTETPLITVTESDANANSVVDPASNITSQTDADRTTRITVTAEDGFTSQDYIILFNVAANDAKEITSFGIIDPEVIASINAENNSIDAELPFGTNLSALVASFITTGVEVKIEDISQISETTENDFTFPVTYTVIAEDESTQDYIVTITTTPGSTNARLSELTIDTGILVPVFNPEIYNYTVKLPFGTSTEPIISAKKADENAEMQIVQATNIQGDIAARTATILITAEDGLTTQDYTILFNVEASNAKEITSFCIIEPEVIASINAEDNSIDAELPFGTDLSALVASFITTGVEVKVEDISQISETTENDFTFPVTYTVIAEDESTQDYIVTITTTPGSTNARLSELTIDTGILFPVFNPEIYNYTVKLPFGTSTEPIISAKKADENAEIQINQATNIEGDISERTATIHVTAEDGITKNIYTILFTVALNHEKDILSFVLENLDPDVIGIISNETNTITLTVPFGTDITKLLPTISISPDANISPLSGVVQDFSYPISYIVTAQNGTSRNWIVAVNISTGISMFKENLSFNIFPNPSNGMLTLKLNASKASNLNVDIINIQGQLVYSRKINKDGDYKDQVDLRNKPDGIYYIRVFDGNSISVSKIIICK